MRTLAGQLEERRIRLAPIDAYRRRLHAGLVQGVERAEEQRARFTVRQDQIRASPERGDRSDTNPRTKFEDAPGVQDVVGHER